MNPEDVKAMLLEDLEHGTRTIEDVQQLASTHESLVSRGLTQEDSGYYQGIKATLLEVQPS